ncbi:MAG: PTS sugar transporter subunit IIA [Spirochaetales bacterium]|nr:PTS sugar transporter subunit IIA [Spirochaetales bacterium]
MALVDLIEKNVIKIPMTAESKTAAIDEMIEVLVNANKISHPGAVRQAILKREDLGSTGLENGIAVPHAKCDEVDKLILALGISPRGIDFEAMDGNPSHLFFMILAPPDQSGPHIEALAEIAKITRSKSFYKLLITAANAEEVVELFHEE